MRGEHVIDLRLRFDRRQLIAALALGLVAVAPHDLASESFTLTTYYPAPSGVYTRMITTDSTWLARDGGGVSIGTTSTPPNGLVVAGGNVGIGTSSPQAALDVNGAVRLGTGICGPGTVGSLQYSAGQVQYCDGASWKSLSGSAAHFVKPASLGGIPASWGSYDITSLIGGATASSALLYVSWNCGYQSNGSGIAYAKDASGDIYTLLAQWGPGNNDSPDQTSVEAWVPVVSRLVGGVPHSFVDLKTAGSPGCYTGVVYGYQ